MTIGGLLFTALVLVLLAAFTFAALARAIEALIKRRIL